MVWHTSKLGDVCEMIKRGIAPKYVEDDGVLVINQKCIRDHSVNYDIARQHNSELKKVSEERYIKAGDVLVNSTGTGTLGRVAQVRLPPDDPVTVDTHVTIVRPKPGLFYSDFFGYMLIKIEEEITAAGEGASGQTELARTKLENEFFVSYPDSLPEQKRIVAILDQAFADIDKARALTEQNLKNARELFDSYLQQICTYQEPKWRECLVGDVCDLFQGLAINQKTKHLLVEKSSLPLLRIKDLRSKTFEQYVAEDGYPEKARVYEDDIVYTRTGQIGLVFRGFNGVLHNNAFRVVSNNEINKDYLYWWLQHSQFKDVVIGLASRAAQPDITHTLFKKQKIVIPSLDYQARSVDLLEWLNMEGRRLQTVYLEKLDKLDLMKKAILKKAFSGELTKNKQEAA